MCGAYLGLRYQTKQSVLDVWVCDRSATEIPILNGKFVSSSGNQFDTMPDLLDHLKASSSAQHDNAGIPVRLTHAVRTFDASLEPVDESFRRRLSATHIASLSQINQNGVTSGFEMCFVPSTDIC